MMTRRDALLGLLTSRLNRQVREGTFVGHESGVSVLVRHESIADFTWDELESSNDPVEFARKRLVAAVIG
jgi:hypothetical protein